VFKGFGLMIYGFRVLGFRVLHLLLGFGFKVKGLNTYQHLSLSANLLTPVPRLYRSRSYTLHFSQESWSETNPKP
jgi:hypothetical protein